MDLEYQLLEASRSGDLDTVVKILNQRPDIVNCRDRAGRLSTPLHFASGYNRVAVVDYLLQHNADVHAKDKGGLSKSRSLNTLLLAFYCLFTCQTPVSLPVALHNACSYGHFEVVS